VIKAGLIAIFSKHEILDSLTIRAINFLHVQSIGSIGITNTAKDTNGSFNMGIIREEIFSQFSNSCCWCIGHSPSHGFIKINFSISISVTMSKIFFGNFILGDGHTNIRVKFIMADASTEIFITSTHDNMYHGLCFIMVIIIIFIFYSPIFFKSIGKFMSINVTIPINRMKTFFIASITENESLDSLAIFAIKFIHVQSPAAIMVTNATHYTDYSFNMGVI